MSRGHIAARTVAAGTSTSDDAATVATRARSGVTSPLPSGCTRFERNTTNTRVAGSIQSDVPVNPVWPNDPSGSNSPRFAEYDESRSQPSPRTFGSPAGVAGDVMRATVSGDRMRVVPTAPPPSSMRQKSERSAAVLNRPAWPATPPMRRAVGSCTTPRSITSMPPRVVASPHGASAALQFCVGAMRPASDAAGLNIVSRIPSGAEDAVADEHVERRVADPRDDLAEQKES